MWTVNHSPCTCGSGAAGERGLPELAVRTADDYETLAPRLFASAGRGGGGGVRLARRGTAACDVDGWAHLFFAGLAMALDAQAVMLGSEAAAAASVSRSGRALCPGI